MPLNKKEALVILKKIICHINPKLPAVKPTAQKNKNSIKSLLPVGIELNATLIR